MTETTLIGLALLAFGLAGGNYILSACAGLILISPLVIFLARST